MSLQKQFLSTRKCLAKVSNDVLCIFNADRKSNGRCLRASLPPLVFRELGMHHRRGVRDESSAVTQVCNKRDHFHRVNNMLPSIVATFHTEGEQCSCTVWTIPLCEGMVGAGFKTCVSHT